ncbi:MAG: hypothetical protein FJZ01_26445 [Candidatus Sericytochromatia bacterium]|nr:hypothetical protein [Candidatus Tanganyikabacteria bacterium]
MANRFLPLALTLSVAATGCAQALLAGRTGTVGGPAVNVEAPKAAPAGWGKVVVDVRGLQQVPEFHTAAMAGLTIGKAVLIVRDSAGAIVTDVSGSPAAYYFTVPTSGNATIGIPDLPSTATSTATAVSSGSPHRFELRAFTSAQTVALLGDNFHVNTIDSGFGDEVTKLTDAQMMAPGETKAHVVAGLPAIVTVYSRAHFGANLDNSASPVVKAVTLSSVPTFTGPTDEHGFGSGGTASGVLRLRLTNLQAAKLGSATGRGKGTFTVGGTPKAGDKFAITVNDNADTINSYYIEYTVPPGGQTAAAAASGIASAITGQLVAGGSATRKFPDSYTGSSQSGTVSILGHIASGSFANLSVATVALTGPAASDYAVAENILTPGDATNAFHADPVYSSVAGAQEGDVVTASFTNAGGTTISGSYTVAGGDGIEEVAGGLATALAADDDAEGDQYSIFTLSGGSIHIGAKAVGAAFNVAPGGFSVTETHPIGSSVSSSVTIENCIKRFRVLLNFPSAVTSNILFRVFDSTWTRLKDTTGTSLNLIAGTKLFASVSPVPSNANTQHWVDVDDETRGRRFPDGVVDITLSGVPSYSSVQVIDHVMGDGAQSSTIVK